MKLVPFSSAARFLSRAEDFLLANESANSLPLGLALRTRDEQHPSDEGARFFAIEQRGALLGTISQTPGRAVLFTSMSAEAARFAARELPGQLEDLIGCNGPRTTVDVVAAEWSAADLGDLRLRTDLRLFELTELTPPRPCPGHLRIATIEDLELCRRWTYHFLIDCRLPEATPGALPERVHPLEDQRLFLWEVEGRPVACAAWARPIRDSITIGYVYTPDEERGRGYASNAVAALTAGLLDGSLHAPARRYVNLFTDLANPTSNSIYRKMGYRGIEDFRLYQFEREPG